MSKFTALLISFVVFFGFFFSSSSAQVTDENGAVFGRAKVANDALFTIASFPTKLRLDSWGEIVQNNRKPPDIKIHLDVGDAEDWEAELTENMDIRYSNPLNSSFHYGKVILRSVEEKSLRANGYLRKYNIMRLNMTTYLHKDGHYAVIRPIGLEDRELRWVGGGTTGKPRKVFYWDYIIYEYGYWSPEAIERLRAKNPQGTMARANPAIAK